VSNISPGWGRRTQNPGRNQLPPLDENRTFTFRSRPEAVAAARRALDGLEDRLEASVFYDASLCLSELVTNAVLHSGAAEEDELELKVSLAGDRLRVTVVDHGGGFEPGEPTGGDESGWGLYIVDRLSHQWGVEREPHDTACTVWFEMSATAGAEEAGTREEEAVRNGAADGSRGINRSAFSRLGPEPSTA
jgi:anti-sigma regulatory factor (Ser/Thr protein kinase)